MMMAYLTFKMPYFQVVSKLLKFDIILDGNF